MTRGNKNTIIQLWSNILSFFILKTTLLNKYGRSSAVRTVTMPRTGRSGILIPVGAKNFSLLQKSRLDLWYRGTFPGVKRLGLYVNHLHPSNAEVKG